MRTGRSSPLPQPGLAESPGDYRLRRSPGGPARKGAGPRSGGVRRRPRQAGAGAGRARVRTRSGPARAALRGALAGRGRIRPKPGAVPAPSPTPGSATTPAPKPVGPETRPYPDWSASPGLPSLLADLAGDRQSPSCPATWKPGLLGSPAVPASPPPPPVRRAPGQRLR